MPAPGMAEVIFKFKDDALEAFKKFNQRNLDGHLTHDVQTPDHLLKQDGFQRVWTEVSKLSFCTNLKCKKET